MPVSKKLEKPPRGDFTKKSLTEVQKLIAKDYSPIAQKIARSMKWSNERVRDRIERFRKYRIMCELFPGHWLLPTQDINVVWDVVVQDNITGELALVFFAGMMKPSLLHSGFCTKHAVPKGGDFPAGRRRAFQRASRLYRRLFKEPYELPDDPMLKVD